LKELDEFLLARAMEHDSPTLLFRLVCEYLISAKVIRPGPVTVVKRVAHAREVAQRETFDRLAHELTDERRTALDGLLVTDPAIGMTRPDRHENAGGIGVPARRATAYPPSQPRPDRRALGRPAPAGRIAEVRARCRLAAGLASCRRPAGRTRSRRR
jgi:hypothetical protein